MTPKTTPKDFFLHLGAALALYIAAGALINLAFSIINYAFPDALAGYFSVNSIAWPISMLVVLVPILYGIEALINRDVRRMPEKKDIWVRRWRIFLTLFLVVVLIGGDLIALINVYLNGEITARFIWKIVAILLVAGSIGKYYFYSMYENWKYATFIRRGNAWFGIVLVVAAIVGGFWIVGSPATQRALRFDQERVSDLQNIQWQIVTYWQQKGALPTALTDLNDSISGTKVPNDPETGQPYEYNDKGVTALKTTQTGYVFSLCATFDRASVDGQGRGASYSGGVIVPTVAIYPGGDSDSWTHPVGHTCFDRTVDPTRYPVQKIQPM